MALLRIADSSDAATYFNVNVGDYIIEPNPSNLANADIFVRNDPSWNGGVRVIDLENMPTPNGVHPKICIRGGAYQYGSIKLYFKGQDSTLSNGLPVIITNFDGLVNVNTINIGGLNNFIISGKYDVSKQTGHEGISRGIKFKSIYIASDAYGGGTEYTSTYGELMFLESTNGNFVGLQMKSDHLNDAEGGAMYGMKIHDCFFNSTLSGEGVYIGHTGIGSEEHTIYMQFYNNVIAFTAREGIQIGRLGAGSKVYNNIMLCSATRWLYPNPDGVFNNQSYGCQFGFRSGGVEIKNNIILGGVSNVIWQVDDSGQDPKTAEPIIIENNFFGDFRENTFYFLGNGWSSAVLLFKNNYFGKYNFRADIYNNRSEPSGFVTGANIAYNIIFENNVKQFTKPLIRAFAPPVGTNGGTLTEINTTTDNTIVNPHFEGLTLPVGFDDFSLVEQYLDVIGGGVNNGDPITYYVGQIVLHPTTIQPYLVTQNVSGVIPGETVGWESYYDLIDLNLEYDSLRLLAGSFYSNLGMGLLETATPDVESISTTKPRRGLLMFL